MNFDDSPDLLKKLDDSIKECAHLKEENELLKKLLSIHNAASVSIKEKKVEFTSDKIAFSQEEKIKIFRNLFRGREDVFAIRWISRKGKSGYSPSCTNEWDKQLCHKPKISCSECNNKKYMPLTNETIYKHLSGKQTIGMYPLLPDETCWWLAVDFDGASWQSDASSYLTICDDLNIPAAIERSRSGNGCHVWIFFEENVPATLARKLGAIILSKALENRYQIGFRSYDRFFPNQDTMPKGGFGNLIALPLQKVPRENGCSVFVDAELRPFHDQWVFLAQIRRLSEDEIGALISKLCHGSELGELKQDDEEATKPWETSRSKLSQHEFPNAIQVVRANMLYIGKSGISQRALNALKRLAAFKNPEFYRAQAMRMSTYGKPRIISCAEETPEYLCLPRGCEMDLATLLAEAGVEVEWSDKTYPGRHIEVA